MLKEQDLINVGFKVIKPNDYNQGTDIYQKVYVLPTSEYEKKKLRLRIGDDLTDPEFCYFIKIFPKYGYKVENGIIIRKSTVPHIWGDTIFNGIVDNMDDLIKLLKQLGVDE